MGRKALLGVALALCVCVGVGWTSAGQRPRQWEYRVVEVPYSADGSSQQLELYAARLNEQDAAGWELVSVTPREAGHAAYLFMRRPK